MHIGESNTPRLRACIEVMLCRGEVLRDPTIDAVCSGLLCREVEAWLGLSSVLTGDAEGSRVAFWGCLTIGGGGFANTCFLWARGVA